MNNKNKGFTLIEIMMVVAIIGILVAIALPSYKQHVLRGNRTAVQAEMMQISSSLERYRSQQLTYANADITKSVIYGANKYPKTGNTLYNLSLAVAANGLSWELTATPTGAQKNNGALKIDNTGKRCWNQSSDSTCDLNSTSQPWK